MKQMHSVRINVLRKQLADKNNNVCTIGLTHKTCAVTCSLPKTIIY